MGLDTVTPTPEPPRPRSDQRGDWRELVSLNEWIQSCLGRDADFRGQVEEVDSVGPREIGYRDELPFLPEQPIGKARDIAHMDASANHATAFADRRQCKWHQRAHGRKDDGRVELLGWGFVGILLPNSPPGTGRRLGWRRHPAG